MTPPRNYDYAIVGGGLQGCLLAHAVAHYRPAASVLLLERSDELCGNHTWSFHESDIPPESRGWFDRLVNHRWPAYTVRFPGHTRRVTLAYATITSDALRDATRSLSAGSTDASGVARIDIRTGQPCEIESNTRIELADGTVIQSGCVIDCRGQLNSASKLKGVGFQTFIGREYQTDRDWPATEPILMDVRADQSNGFEFLYELPLGKRRVLLEYTRFSEEPSYDEKRANAAIATRLHEAGIDLPELVRTEGGCLPMPYAALPRGNPNAIAGGYAGGWYHAATGYSMPLAIRFAETVAKSRLEEVAAELTRVGSGDALRRGFARFLNRLLFCLVNAEHRWKIFRRFYKVLPEERIARFYGHRFNVADAARIVIGRPPTGLAPLRFAKSLCSRTDPASP
ncbi:lycopene beta-cyclase CrtY [Botrimarina sp.]|uniref:lycopene beta-cyclase CrtY n=1 Tax=Botrimarina sp. TaxID=2795802 RepID=UPI0032EBD0B7